MRETTDLESRHREMKMGIHLCWGGVGKETGNVLHKRGAMPCFEGRLSLPLRKGRKDISSGKHVCAMQRWQEVYSDGGWGAEGEMR